MGIVFAFFFVSGMFKQTKSSTERRCYMKSVDVIGSDLVLEVYRLAERYGTTSEDMAVYLVRRGLEAERNDPTFLPWDIREYRFGTYIPHGIDIEVRGIGKDGQRI